MKQIDISMIDDELYNFISHEHKLYDSIINDEREGFTPEFQEKARMFIRGVILDTEIGALHTEGD